MDWDENLTARELSDKFNIKNTSDGAIFTFARRYNLKFFKMRKNLHKKSTPYQLKISAARKLRHENWTYEMIAKVFGCSRQNIEKMIIDNRGVILGR